MLVVEKLWPPSRIPKEKPRETSVLGESGVLNKLRAVSRLLENLWEERNEESKTSVTGECNMRVASKEAASPE